MAAQDGVWETYYRKVDGFPPRPITQAMIERLQGRDGVVAVDMGCGAGRDTAGLLQAGFEVHAFDGEAAAVTACRQRFQDCPGLHLSHSGFADFTYPAADLVMAWASLYFCPAADFDAVWAKILAALKSGGWFCGDFLGVRDSWIEDECRAMAAFTEADLRARLAGLELEKLHIRDEDGQTVAGRAKHWHTFTVIARKPD